MSAKLDQLMVHAGNVLRATKNIDFQRVVEHHEPSVDYLHQVLDVACREAERIKELGMLRDDPGLLQKSYVINDGIELVGDDSEERKRMTIELINDMGFGNRIGKVYSSLEGQGAIDFDTLGETSGLPGFELVLVPDDTPANSISGVFVDESCVTLATLYDPIANNEWQPKIKKAYDDPMEMLDLVKRLVKRGSKEVS